jgi:hypothetical protein
MPPSPLLLDRAGGEAAYSTTSVAGVVAMAIRAAVTGCCAPVVKVTPNRNSFQMPVNCQITVTMRMGGESGSTIRQKVRK